MFNALFLFVSFFGAIGSQDIIETLSPPHPCQENSCENESVLTITSPNGVSSFELIAEQLGTPVNEANIESAIINNQNLTENSTDVEFMLAVALFFNQNLHTSWDVPETASGVVFDPVYSMLNFSSMLCGEFVSNGIILVNRIRSSFSLPHLSMRKAWLNGHVVMEYYDNQHQKWVYFDLDGAGGHLVLVSDNNGFYASIEEIIINPSLILSSDGIVLLREDGLSANCIKEIFYLGANDLFESIIYTEVLDSFPPLKRTGITIDSLASVQFYDYTGDYWWFDTIGLNNLLLDICDSSELSFLHSLQADSGCSPEFYIECMFQGLSEINEFANLSEFIAFLQTDKYYSFKLGKPHYKEAFRGGGEVFTINMKPGEYDSLTNYYVGYLVKKVMPENPGYDFMFNGKIYSDTFEIEKYLNREDEALDSIPRNPKDLINEVGYSASVPLGVGSLKVEYYMNYHTFSFMDTVQRILIEKGDLEMNQSFKYENVDTVATALANAPSRDSKQGISVYPNPTNGLVNISSTYKTAEILVIDLSGRVVLQSYNVNVVDISSLSEGLYFLNINSENGMYSAKIEKKN